MLTNTKMHWVTKQGTDVENSLQICAICIHIHIYIHRYIHLNAKVDILKIIPSHSKPSYTGFLSKSIKLFSSYVLPSGILVLSCESQKK